MKNNIKLFLVMLTAYTMYTPSFGAAASTTSIAAASSATAPVTATATPAGSKCAAALTALNTTSPVQVLVPVVYLFASGRHEVTYQLVPQNETMASIHARAKIKYDRRGSEFTIRSADFKLQMNLRRNEIPSNAHSTKFPTVTLTDPVTKYEPSDIRFVEKNIVLVVENRAPKAALTKPHPRSRKPKRSKDK